MERALNLQMKNIWGKFLRYKPLVCNHYTRSTSWAFSLLHARRSENLRRATAREGLCPERKFLRYKPSVCSHYSINFNKLQTVISYKPHKSSWKCKLTIIELCIETVFVQKLFMSTLLNNLPLVHHQNQIRLFNSRQAMRHNKARPPLHHSVKGLLYMHLGTGV